VKPIRSAIVMTRTIPSAPRQVFAAWTEPSKIRRWLAPPPCRVAQAEIDARVGGRYRIVVADPSGGTHVTSGEYLELEPGSRLVKTWIYEGPPRSESLLTVEFREIRPGVTELTLRHDRLVSSSDRAKVGAGWVLCLDELESALAPDPDIPFEENR
jgi:uncharacterized protein